MFRFSKDIEAALAKNPKFLDYRKINRGEYRHLRCEFPELMGWNTLRRPEWLPRSQKYPYYARPYGIQGRCQERLMRPHVNRVKYPSYAEDKKADIDSDKKSMDKRPCKPKTAIKPKSNANDPILMQKVEEENERMLKFRKQMFKRYLLFRSDVLRQPNYQRQELERAEGMLKTAEGLIGHKPYSEDKLRYNFDTLHEYEKLHRNEYWPSLFHFNPIKCRHLGIRRNYCSIKTSPKDMAGNLLKLQDKKVKQYPVPPNKSDPPKRPPLNLEYVDVDDFA